MNVQQFHEQATWFLTELKKRMSAKNIDLSANWSIDHLCFRVADLAAFEAKKQAFQEFATMLAESQVNGRPICTFKLSQPIHFLDRKIDLVELPAPKQGKITKEGFDHIEVVCDQIFSEIKNKFGGSDFDDKSISKDFNAELELKLGDLAIKFHHLSLASVIRLENNKKVYAAIVKSQVLSRCRDFSPLIAGTFPLGIQTENSDVDILLFCDDLEKALLRLKNIYGSFDAFESYKSKLAPSETTYGIVRFCLDEVPFELYLENTPTVRQRAYLHFQIEERLLRLGGERLVQTIIDLRKRGMKTEPAFAVALNLQGDPYLKLLEMHHWSEKKLDSLVKESFPG
jgi:predicted metalloenzyme YecM